MEFEEKDSMVFDEVIDKNGFEGLFAYLLNRDDIFVTLRNWMMLKGVYMNVLLNDLYKVRMCFFIILYALNI